MFVHVLCSTCTAGLPLAHFLTQQTYSFCFIRCICVTSNCLASTRKVYEQKLQKLMEQPAAEPEAPTAVTALPKADSNGNSDHYSDKEDGEH